MHSAWSCQERQLHAAFFRLLCSEASLKKSFFIDGASFVQTETAESRSKSIRLQKGLLHSIVTVLGEHALTSVPLAITTKAKIAAIAGCLSRVIRGRTGRGLAREISVEILSSRL